MAGLCPTGGSYWNPKLCWWCTSSPFCTVITRGYDLFRIVAWVVGRIIDLFTTIVFGIIIPFIGLVFVSAVAFISFMIGLLIGQIRFQLQIFFPLFLLVGAWILWLFWPEVGCFIEKEGWPFLNFFFDLFGTTFSFAITIVNVLIRIFNSFVPLIGFVLYIGITLLTMYFSAMVQIMGEFDVYALLDALMDVIVLVVEIVIEFIGALVAASTQELSQGIDLIGPVITVAFDAVGLWLRVGIWVWGKLWYLLEPILGAVVKVTQFVRKHFFLARILLDVDPSLRDMSTTDDLSDDLWRTVGMSGNQYWDDDSGSHAMGMLRGMNRWGKGHSAERAIEYYKMKRMMLFGHASSFRGRRLMEEDGLPSGWTADGTEEEEETPKESVVESIHDHVIMFSNIHEQLHSNDKEVRPHPIPLEEEIATYRVRCKSKHCGGDEAHLPHPFITMSRQKFAPHRHETAEQHRIRLTHVAALAHVARHTLRNTVQKHWHEGDGRVTQNMALAWQHMTGHKTLHQTFEYLTTQREDPVESLATFVPVFSEWFPFTYFLDSEYHSDEYRNGFVGHHVRKQVRMHRRALRQRSLLDEGNEEEAAEIEEPDEPLYYMGDVLAHHERRGQFAPAGSPTTGAPISEGPPSQNQPTLPVLQLLYKQDCNIKPFNPLCLPYIPSQIGCLVKMLLHLFPNKPPVQFCHYEEQCASVGFCIIKRPLITPDLLQIFANTNLWISLCWIRNGFVWIGVVLSFILPIVRDTFKVLSALIPFLSFFFDAFVAIIPELVSFQETVCLIPFFYGLTLDILLLWLFYFFVVPLLRFVRRSFTTLEAMFGAIRSIEMTMLAYKQNSGYAEMYKQFYETQPKNVLVHDPWTGRPALVEPPRDTSLGDSENAMVTHAQQAHMLSSSSSYASTAPAYEPGAGASIPSLFDTELRVRNAGNFSQVPLMSQIGTDRQAEEGGASDEPLTPQQQHAIREYALAVERSLIHFGEPVGIVTSAHVHEFESRFGPLIHSGHWSYEWLRRYIGEHHHQLDVIATRAPPRILYLRGWFPHLFQ